MSCKGTRNLFISNCIIYKHLVISLNSRNLLIHVLVHKPFSLWETFHLSEKVTHKIFKVRLLHGETTIRSRCWLDFPWGITHYCYLFLIKFPHSFYYSYLIPEFHQATKALMRRKRNLNKDKNIRTRIHTSKLYRYLCFDKRYHPKMQHYILLQSALILLWV